MIVEFNGWSKDDGLRKMIHIRAGSEIEWKDGKDDALIRTIFGRYSVGKAKEFLCILFGNEIEWKDDALIRTIFG